MNIPKSPSTANIANHEKQYGIKLSLRKIILAISAIGLLFNAWLYKNITTNDRIIAMRDRKEKTYIQNIEQIS